MNPNPTRICKAVLALAFTFFTFSLFAQPRYTFRNPVLETGNPSHLKKNARYRFSNVSAGVDALVTIEDMVGGITCTAIDETWTGFDEAFQPFISVPALSNGYVEFQIRFVDAGTSNPRVQTEVPITCLDVDGVNLYNTGRIYERDQVQYLNGYYDFAMSSPNIQILNPGGATGNGWIQGTNLNGDAYDGIDTLAKDVMFTVVNASIHTVRVRIGAYNTSPSHSDVRFRSVYFQRFIYPTSYLLPNRTTLAFSGNYRNNAVELKGTLSASHTFDKIVIERGHSTTGFTAVGEMPVQDNSSSEYRFSFTDTEPVNGTAYYRLRLVNSTRRIIEYSSIIAVKPEQLQKSAFSLTGNVISRHNPALQIASPANNTVQLMVADFSGRVLYKQTVNLSAGNNSLGLSGARLPTSGYGVVNISSATGTVTHKILFQ